MGATRATGLRDVRVVLDTNTVLSALLFPRGRLVWIQELWSAGRILPLVSRATTRELIDALAYPKFELGENEIQTVLAAYLPFTEAVDVDDDLVVDIPACSDPADQMFLRLAGVGDAEVRVSGDRAMLALAGSTRFAVETVGQFQKRFG